MNAQEGHEPRTPAGDGHGDAPGLSGDADHDERRRAGTRFRCVVWRRADATLPEPLRAALAKRPITVLEATNRYTAFAELIESESSRRSDAPATVLLLVEPSDLVQPENLLGAVEAYVPGVLAWEYRCGANPPLRAAVRVGQMRYQHGTVPRTSRDNAEDLTGVEAADRDAAEPALDAGVIRVLGGEGAEWDRASEPAPAGGPSLRLAGEGELPPSGVNSDVESPESESEGSMDARAPLLSDEELEMLLGDDPDEAAHPGQQGGR